MNNADLSNKALKKKRKAINTLIQNGFAKLSGQEYIFHFSGCMGCKKDIVRTFDPKYVLAMIDEIEILRNQITWLAQRIKGCPYPDKPEDFCRGKICPVCWNSASREAIAVANKNNKDNQ